MAQRDAKHKELSAASKINKQEHSDPYIAVCKKRVKDWKKMQDEQFKTEIKNLEAMQQSAYDQIRFHRFLAITTLWPPLHSRKEIENTMRKYYVKPHEHIQRIQYILENKLT